MKINSYTTDNQVDISGIEPTVSWSQSSVKKEISTNPFSKKQRCKHTVK